MRALTILAALMFTVAGCTDDAEPDTLDCGDTGTSPNMPVSAGDPHQLDTDGDGIGCEAP